MIADLAQLRVRGIADQLDVPTATLLGWKQGAEPRYFDGERLVELWMMETGRARSDLPRAPYWRRSR